LYHARQHLWELAAKLYPNDAPRQRRWMMTKQDKLDNGKMESLVGSLRSLATSHPELAKQIRTEADYFEKNTERMRYLKFRRQKLFVGSGVIEAGCNDHWDSAQTIGHVLDRARSQRHHCPPLLPTQR